MTTSLILNKKLLLIAGLTLALLAAWVINLAFADVTGSLLPSSDGAYLQWTLSAGTTHYTLVDESSCNGTTDYNFTNTIGNRDSYGISLASVPDGSTITAIEITPCASRNKGGRGSATMNAFYRYNGVDSADAGGYALTGTTPVNLATTTFSGLSLSKSSSSALQIGAVFSAGTKGARLSRIAVKITYTPLPPSVSTNAATNIGTSSATLNGSANPNGASTTGWFRYSATDPGSCDDVFGTRLPASGGTSLWSGTSPVAYSRVASGLSSGTTYYYCAIASNSGGTGFGGVVSFTTTTPPPPSVTTNTAINVSSTSMTLRGSANPNGFATTGWFRYSDANPGGCDDVFGTRVPASGGTSLGSGTSSVAYSQFVSGLATSTTYYYCAIASSTAGMGFGLIASSTTPAQ